MGSPSLLASPHTSPTGEEKRGDFLRKQTDNLTDPLPAATVPSMKTEVLDVSPSPPPSRPPPSYVMIPVPKEDFKTVNTLAEAAWIASDPDNEQAIKKLRRELVVKHNKEVIQAMMEKAREAREAKK